MKVTTYQHNAQLKIRGLYLQYYRSLWRGGYKFTVSSHYHITQAWISLYGQSLCYVTCSEDFHSLRRDEAKEVVFYALFLGPTPSKNS
jgi:hypothetical protein